MCIKALKDDLWCFGNVRLRSPEICMAAVMANGNNLIQIDEQTPELCLAAVRQNDLAVKFAQEQPEEICLAAVEQNSSALRCSR